MSIAASSSSRRLLTTSARSYSGFFQRPAQVPTLRETQLAATKDAKVAFPHTPPQVDSRQSPNYPKTWSETQQPKDLAYQGPRFEQINYELQPQPLSAMEMIQREPIRLVQSRIAMCDGGRGALGHPKVFINLDKGVKACPYCGLRYEKDHSAHSSHH
ncbi:unnamed protein product [Parajaminaea phylloscopi]